MPGAKRRALKKLLKPESTESESPVNGTSTSASTTDDSSVSSVPVPAGQQSGDSASDVASSPTPVSTSPLAAAIASSVPVAAVVGAPVAGGGGMYGGNLWGAQRGGKKSSKQRFAERQARKKQAILESAPPTDPGWNAQLEKERQEEISVIGNACEVLNREIFEIQPDGHCMFAAVADQLGLMGVLPAHQPAPGVVHIATTRPFITLLKHFANVQSNNPYHTRRVAAQYMRDNQADFLPFLASVDGEDMPGATDDGLMTEDQFGEYCHRVEGTAEWGGEPEIQALCRAFDVPIHVIQRGPPTVVSHGGANDAFGGATTPEKSLDCGERVVRISYHRRMYGLGEHYNSLRPAT
ncbi:uncharacterized protein EHS24_006066 [Apiotrichum porosum]|uniref:OTU domain-containing protein n=1 Tax=Apiotrichum porosum TaxID=105984 RepID=A0A427Y088_9TREE|nr:uncharacterized protein EHS24_006066 [Apiotrichum porosum]RSH84544.1 hypothetical protein EHS24_006066 [Apiotrichum porosum]